MTPNERLAEIDGQINALQLKRIKLNPNTGSEAWLELDDFDDACEFVNIIEIIEELELERLELTMKKALS